MRIAALRPLIVLGASALVVLGAAAPAGAHGGTTLAQGGQGGTTILLQAEPTTTASGGEAIDLSTVLNGPGTGAKATVVYWIRPAGGKTFRVTTTRDEAGIAHTDVSTANRGSWRAWDVSAVVDLTSGKRLRVSNAESNPPGPDPASTAGGGATGADPGEAAGTTTAQDGTSGGTTPGTDTGTAPPAGTSTSSTTTSPDGSTTTRGNGEDAGTSTLTQPYDDVSDVTGKGEGTPGWVVPSAIVIVVLAVGFVLVRRRRTGGTGGTGGPDQD